MYSIAARHGSAPSSVNEDRLTGKVIDEIMEQIVCVLHMYRQPTKRRISVGRHLFQQCQTTTMTRDIGLHEHTKAADAKFQRDSYPFSIFHRKHTVIAVIVPAHNEEDEIFHCLTALRLAARCPNLCGEQTVVMVALDACTDRTSRIAQRMTATTIALSERNVGAARALGAELALAAGARWLAFTDADTQVAPDWISAQLAQNTDVVCGTVAVRNWGNYGHTMRKHYEATYTDSDGHRHVHGANLGMSAKAYERAGGFQPLVSSEDVALVESLKASGASIAWSAAPRVFTSARRIFRAPDGFGATLARINQDSRILRSEQAQA